MAAGLALALAACLGPIANPDLWWHLSAGRYVLLHHAAPRADFLSWTRQGQPWIDFEWGAQALLSLCERLGGFRALWLLKSSAFAGLVALFAALLKSWRLPDSWTGAALVPFAACLVPSLDLRPEIASFAFCLLELGALEARRAGPRRTGDAALLAAHFALYAAWANLHAGFPLGLLLCLCFGAGEAFRGRREPIWLLLAAAGALGTLANPYGPRIYGVFLEHWRQAAALRAHVVEWYRPGLANYYLAPYWAATAFSILVFARGWATGKSAPAAHVAAAAAFAALSAASARLTVYGGLIVFPLALRAAWRQDWPASRRRPRRWLLGAALAGVAALGAAALWRDGLFRRLDSTGRLAPKGVARFLAREAPVLSRLRMYNSFNAGGYLGYALYPDYKVFMDGRYLFGGDLKLVAEQALASPDSWGRFLSERGIALAVMELPAVLAGGRPVDLYYFPREDWALVDWDGRYGVWARRAAVPAGWLARREFRLLHPRDLRFLSLDVISRGAPVRSAVLAEVDRYVREDGEPAEAERLARWARTLDGETR